MKKHVDSRKTRIRSQQQN